MVMPGLPESMEDVYRWNHVDATDSYQPETVEGNEYSLARHHNRENQPNEETLPDTSYQAVLDEFTPSTALQDDSDERDRAEDDLIPEIQYSTVERTDLSPDNATSEAADKRGGVINTQFMGHGTTRARPVNKPASNGKCSIHP